MNFRKKYVNESKNQAAANTSSIAQAQYDKAFQFVDERPEAIAQRRMQDHISSSPLVSKTKLLQSMSPNRLKLEQDEGSLHCKQEPLQCKNVKEPQDKPVQRMVYIGDGAKNKFVKKRAILSKLRDTQFKRGPEIQNNIVEILEGGGVEVNEYILDIFRNLGPVIETAAQLLAKPDIELTFDDWDQALDLSLPMILPIAMTRILIERLKKQFNVAKEGVNTSEGGGLLAYSEERFEEAMATAKAHSGLSFFEWTNALAWAQVQITELQHLNKPKVAPEDEGWSQTKKKSQKKKEAQQEVSIVQLVRDIDDHKGDPDAIAEQFNRFVNALVAQSVPTVPRIVDKYETVSDRKKDQFSIEAVIPLLNNWVIHAHCKNTNGGTANGVNAIHYKRINDKYTLGMSIELTSRQERILLPEPSERKAFKF